MGSLLKKHKLTAILLTLMVVITPIFVLAQSNELAATLEVITAGVEVKRVNTDSWIPVKVEAIVGVGDTIRTDATGRARITFFADGVDTELLPETEYRIERFSGSDDSFTITAEVLVGQTTQRLSRLLNAQSSYDVKTPAMSLTARGTAFAIRVEADGRAGMLVTEGTVEAADAQNTAEVPNEFGIRTGVDETLSDVVRASSFAELDAALDGCDVSVTMPDDVSVNVRVSPNVDSPRVGTISADEIVNFIGVTETTQWYRIHFRGGFGWLRASSAVVGANCAGLRVFPDGHGPEDVSLYSVLGDPVDEETFTVTPTVAAPETEEAVNDDESVATEEASEETEESTTNS